MDKQVEIKIGEGAMVDLLNQEMKELQDSQKQIEEMAKDMLEYGMTKYPTSESIFTETKLRESFYHVFLTYAEPLIRKGYRKIPEGAVVLTREDYEELQIGKDFNYGYHCGEDNMTLYYENIKLPEVRKETAEKFAEQMGEKTAEFLEEKLKHDDFVNGKTALIKFTVAIAKHIADEIVKEITGGEV